MTHDTEFDLTLAALFAGVSTPPAPARVLGSALDRIRVTSQDRGIRLRLGTATRVGPRWRVTLAAAAVIAALLAALAIAAALGPHPDPSEFRLVVVRQDQSKSGPMVSVTAIGPGETRTLTLIDADRTLGGPWTGGPVRSTSDGRLAIPTSTGAEDSQISIVDLHDPGAPALHPDVVGARGYWTSDGRFAVDLGDLDTAAYDLGTGQTVPVAREAAPQDPHSPLGPRRLGRDGAPILEPLDLETRHPGERMTDYSAAADGGLWALFERSAGFREIHLVHTTPAGVDRDVASFQAPPPEPDTVLTNATFVAMAPDDRQVVIGTGDPGSTGPKVIVDTATGSVSDPLDGAVVGWLDVAALATRRPGNGPMTAIPDLVRGEWIRVDDTTADTTGGARRLRLGYTQAVIDPDTGVTLTVAADGPDRLRFAQTDRGPACDAASTGSYAWTIEGDVLSLSPLSDPCPARRGLLTGRYERNLPNGGNFSASLPAGTTYLVPEAGLRLTIPTSSDGWVWRHNAGGVTIGRASDDHWQLTRARVGVSDTCVEYQEVPIGPGIEGVLAYLDSLVAKGIALTDRHAVTVGGRPAVRGTLRLTAPSCPGVTSELIGSGNGSGGTVPVDGDELTIFDTADGQGWVIDSGATDPASVAWHEALLASLEFVEPSR